MILSKTSDCQIVGVSEVDKENDFATQPGIKEFNKQHQGVMHST